MPITATAQGKEFTFPDGTTPEQMGEAIDGFFSQQQGGTQDAGMGATPSTRDDSQLGATQDPDVPAAGQGGEISPESQEFAGMFKTVGELQAFDQAVQAGMAQGLPRNIAQTQALSPPPTQEKQRQFVKGLPEAALNLASGAIAEPVAGISGLVASALPGEEGQGARVVEAVKKFITVDPFTESGKEATQAIGGTLGQIFEPLQKGAEAAGQATLDVTGSPLLATGVETVLKGVPEVFGAGKIIKSKGFNARKDEIEAVELMQDGAPSSDRLKTEARVIYNELSDAGLKVKSESFNGLADNLRQDLRKQGFNKRIHPKVESALIEIESNRGRNIDLTEVDTLRRIAQSAAKSIEPDEARLGSMVVEKIDNYMDGLTSKSFTGGKGENVGGKYKEARSFWSRAKKSEVIQEAVQKASAQASGFENGLRVQFRRILNSGKLRRGFNPEELNAMRAVVEGSTASNMAKHLGKFGFSEKQAGSMLLGSLGTAGGFAVGGIAGGVLVPLIGQVSKNLASKLTQGKAKFADDVVRAGKDGLNVARAYVRNVPKSQRTPEELTQLLLRGGIDLSSIKNSKNKLFNDAAFFAVTLKEQQEQQEGQAN